MKPSRSFIAGLAAFVVLGGAGAPFASAQDAPRKPVTSAIDLPRFTYPIDGTASGLGKFGRSEDKPDAKLLSGLFTIALVGARAEPARRRATPTRPRFKSGTRPRSHRCRSASVGTTYRETKSIGKDAADRKALAPHYFAIERMALYAALKSAPGVLFICAAGRLLSR